MYNRTSLLPVSQARQVNLCILVSMTNLPTSNKKLSVTNATRMTQDPVGARGMGRWSQMFIHKMLWSQNYKIYKGLEQKTLFTEISPPTFEIFQGESSFTISCDFTVCCFTFADSHFSILINFIIKKLSTSS